MHFYRPDILYKYCGKIEVKDYDILLKPLSKKFMSLLKVYELLENLSINTPL